MCHEKLSQKSNSRVLPTHTFLIRNGNSIKWELVHSFDPHLLQKWEPISLNRYCTSYRRKLYSLVQWPTQALKRLCSLRFLEILNVCVLTEIPQLLCFIHDFLYDSCIPCQLIGYSMLCYADLCVRSPKLVCSLNTQVPFRTHKYPYVDHWTQPSEICCDLAE